MEKLKNRPKIALMSYAMDGRAAKGTALYARKLIGGLLDDEKFDFYLVHYDKVGDPLYQKAKEIIMPRVRLPYGSKFISQLLFFWQYRKEQFDIIHLGNVIEHLGDPKKALIKIHSLLKPGGEIIIITPNFDSLSAMVFRNYWYALDSPRHLFLFSPKTIFRLLSETGFSVLGINSSPDVRVTIKSINYLFDRKDMRINFIIWHLLWLVFKPIGNLASLFNKTSTMTIRAKKI